MNWKEIKEKYPKAWVRMIKYFGTHELAYDEIPCKSWSDQYGRIDGKINERDLYDFFDEQGIYISVYLKDYKTCDLWWIDICAKGRPTPLPVKGKQNRKEAEEQAFIKAFEILEGAI